MNRTPLILICGQAGSGKDTVASFMVKNHGAVTIAQADPMKRLAKLLFDFTDDQLWGPSESRNAVDHRYDPEHLTAEAWDGVWERFNHQSIDAWLRDLFPDLEFLNLPTDKGAGPRPALRNWLNQVMTQTYWAGKALTPRYVLQTLGTEWGRAQGRDIWTNYAVNAAWKLLGGGYSYDRAQGLTEAKDGSPRWVVITDGRFRNEVVNVLRAGGITIKVFNPQGTDNTAIEAAGVKGHQSEKELGGIPNHFYTATFRNDKTKGLRVAEIYTEDFMTRLEAGQLRAGEYDK
jgi:hypothetical protein